MKCNQTLKISLEIKNGENNRNLEFFYEAVDFSLRYEGMQLYTINIIKYS